MCTILPEILTCNGKIAEPVMLHNGLLYCFVAPTGIALGCALRRGYRLLQVVFMPYCRILSRCNPQCLTRLFSATALFYFVIICAVEYQYITSLFAFSSRSRPRNIRKNGMKVWNTRRDISDTAYIGRIMWGSRTDHVLATFLFWTLYCV